MPWTLDDIDMSGWLGKYKGIDTAAITDPSASKSRRFQAIRQVYAVDHEQTMSACGRNVWCCPYRGIDWTSAMTALENALWEAIRPCFFPLFPQYPVGRRFVDFGNPYYCVAVEADSIAHHDREADQARDAELAELGWRTYRVPSRCLHQPAMWPLDPGMLEDEARAALAPFMRNSPEGLMHALWRVYADPCDVEYSGELADAEAALSVWARRYVR
jgi:hypothetical protein